MDYIEGRKEVSHRIETLRNTCSLTDVILNGKDIELLLLKKDVQDKLVALGTFDVKPLPPTSNKVSNFVHVAHCELTEKTTEEHLQIVCMIFKIHSVV